MTQLAGVGCTLHTYSIGRGASQRNNIATIHHTSAVNKTSASSCHPRDSPLPPALSLFDRFFFYDDRYLPAIACSELRRLPFRLLGDEPRDASHGRRKRSIRLKYSKIFPAKGIDAPAISFQEWILPMLHLSTMMISNTLYLYSLSTLHGSIRPKSPLASPGRSELRNSRRRSCKPVERRQGGNRGRGLPVGLDSSIELQISARRVQRGGSRRRALRSRAARRLPRSRRTLREEYRWLTSRGNSIGSGNYRGESDTGSRGPRSAKEEEGGIDRE